MNHTRVSKQQIHFQIQNLAVTRHDCNHWWINAQLQTTELVFTSGWGQRPLNESAELQTVAEPRDLPWSQGPAPVLSPGTRPRPEPRELLLVHLVVLSSNSNCRKEIPYFLVSLYLKYLSPFFPWHIWPLGGNMSTQLLSHKSLNNWHKVFITQMNEFSHSCNHISGTFLIWLLLTNHHECSLNDVMFDMIFLLRHKMSGVTERWFQTIY